MIFRRKKKLKPVPPKPVPDGLWLKCDKCNNILYRKELEKNLSVCPKCGHHFRISARRYIEILTDGFEEFDKNLSPANPINAPGSAIIISPNDA